MHEQARRIFTVAIMSAILLLSADFAGAQVQPNIGTSAPLQTNSSGGMGIVAAKSVFRVVCKEKGVFGTGFLHKSGDIITAAHVVDGCQNPDIWLSDNTHVSAKVIKTDEGVDLALLKPEKHIDAPALAIANNPDLQVGALISLWGFPAGYIGLPPMLSVGYLSGIDAVRAKTGKMVPQFVLNAAVNHGDSGGPVLLVETGEVIGIADEQNRAIIRHDVVRSRCVGKSRLWVHVHRDPSGWNEA